MWRLPHKVELSQPKSNMTSPKNALLVKKQESEWDKKTFDDMVLNLNMINKQKSTHMEYEKNPEKAIKRIQLEIDIKNDTQMVR